ncbi:hypothetical protein DFH29DRAFT_1003665 [Suillus ampliporus]|nr:hypothetical protein DFH29DRAFT_1003665 [Suillus ampliporus]
MTNTEDLDLREIDACLFDVFGTVLNWHSSYSPSIQPQQGAASRRYLAHRT